MTFKQAVKKLGGATEAARVAGVKRDLIYYWLRQKAPPAWRQGDVDKIIAAAEQCAK